MGTILETGKKVLKGGIAGSLMGGSPLGAVASDYLFKDDRDSYKRPKNDHSKVLEKGGLLPTETSKGLLRSRTNSLNAMGGSL
jgi:hypothetical protein